MKDFDGAVKDDVEKAKSLIRGQRNWTLASLIESACWLLCLCAVAGMLLSLPFVGDEKLISGELWIAASILSMALFAALAIAARAASETVETETFRTGKGGGGR